MAETMKKHGHEKDFSMETFAADDNLRVAYAMDLIEKELKDRGMSLDSEEKEKLEEKLERYIGNSEKIFCEDEAVQYANEIQIERNNKEHNENDNKKDDRNRLDEIAENMENRRKHQ